MKDQKNNSNDLDNKSHPANSSFKLLGRLGPKPKNLVIEMSPISPEILRMLDEAKEMPEGGLSECNTTNFNLSKN